MINTSLYISNDMLHLFSSSVELTQFTSDKNTNILLGHWGNVELNILSTRTDTLVFEDNQAIPKENVTVVCRKN